MTFTDRLEGASYKPELENGKKRSIIENKWPDQNSGMPYEIYKAESNYSYKSFFCNILYIKFKTFLKSNLIILSLFGRI